MFKISQQNFRAQIAALAAVGFLYLVPAAWASSEISFLDQFGNVDYEQTGNGNTLTLNGAFYSADLNSLVNNAYTSASFTPPGGSAITLTNSLGDPTDYHYQTALYSNLAAMEGDFPFGTYSFSGDADTATYDYLSDDYVLSAPYLTGTNYSSLQGMNAALPFTFDLSPYSPGGNSNETNTFIFFTIYDYTTSTTVFNAGFLPDTTTSIPLPANTLTPSNSYDYEVDYSDRDTAPGTGSAFAPQLGFDTRTDGTFSTSAALAPVPEPGSMSLLGTGLIGLAAMLRRRLKAGA